MKRSLLVPTAALGAAVGLLLGVLGAGAVAGVLDDARPGMPGRHGHMPGGPMGGPGDDRMAGSMTGPMAGPMGGPMGAGLHRVDSEVKFLVEMVAHHEEAISAAEELVRSDREQMRAFGAAIVDSQTAQVEQMQDWLAEWHAGSSDEADYQPMMHDLADLEGDELDRTFLQDMVHHHMMAVMMSQQLLTRGLAEHQDVADLAAEIRDEQRGEIRQMRRWLAQWFGDRVGRGPCASYGGRDRAGRSS